MDSRLQGTWWKGTLFDPFVVIHLFCLPAHAHQSHRTSDDGQAFAYGLPGSLDPVKNFDPAGFASGASLAEMKMYREAEVTHGRVSMLAVLGFLVQEKVFPLHIYRNGGYWLVFPAPNPYASRHIYSQVHFLFVDPVKDIGPAIRHLDEVRAVNPWFFEVLTFAIALAEARRSTVGWKSPFKPGLTTALEPGFGTKYTPGSLQEGYYPGDIGFDPLGLKPAGAAEFAEMQTKELQNGRLAMLAIAGAVAQELVDGKSLFS